MIITVLNFLQALAFLGLFGSSVYLYKILNNKKKSASNKLSQTENLILIIVKISLVVWPFTFILIQLDRMFS